MSMNSWMEEGVALGGLDVAQTGAAAHDVDDHGGDAGACAVGDALLLQGHAGAGRRGDDAGAGTGSAVHHVDRRHFALGLQEAAAEIASLPFIRVKAIINPP